MLPMPVRKARIPAGDADYLDFRIGSTNLLLKQLSAPSLHNARRPAESTSPIKTGAIYNMICLYYTQLPEVCK
jgi:hypothetical protein